MSLAGWTPLDLLPGLWVALLATLAALVLRRWFDPIPARCWQLWGILLAVLFGGALFGGRVLLPLGFLTRFPPFERLWPGPGRPPGNLLQGDLILQIAPWLHQVRSALLSGEWPLWNPFAGAGEPLLGNPQAQALQPLAWLALAFPVAAAAGVLAALRVLAACAGFYLFARREGLSATPALWGSAAFGLCGYLLNWVGWPLAGSAALLPLLLYALALTDERGLRRDRALLALAAAALLLVGHPETAMYAFALAAAFALARLARRPAGRRLLLLRSWLAAGAVALGLAAPALLPAAAYLPESHRAELLEARRTRLQQADPLAARGTAAGQGMARRLIPLAAPHAFGNSVFGGYWGERNVLNDTAGFAGTAALLAALLAALPPPPGGRRRHGERLALAAGLASVLVLARPPGLDRLLDAVPLLRQSASFHSRVSLVLCFAVAWLATCALERHRRGEIRRGATPLLAGLLGAAIAWAYLAHPSPRDPAALAGLRQVSLAVQLAALGLGTVLFTRRHADTARGRRLAAAIAVLVFAAEPLLLRAPLNPAVPADLFYPAVQPVRFLATRLAPGERVAGLGNALHPNVASLYGLADARSSNPARPAAVLAALRRLDAGSAQATDVFGAPDDPLYDLLGVRFLVTGPRQRLPAPWQQVLRRAGVRIYRRPGALGRVFLPASASPCDLPAWSDCTAGVRDFAAVAVLRNVPAGGTGDMRRPGEGTSPVPANGTSLAARPDGGASPDRAAPPAGWRAAAPGGSRLDLLAVHPAWIRARADLSERRLLASSVYQDGGWHLLHAGVLLPTTEANGPFLASWLQPGRGPVDLLYRPPGFFAGMLAAALALAAGAALWVRPPWPAGPPRQERARSQTARSPSA